MFHAVIPTPFFKPYATLGTPIVCATDDPSGKGRPACGIYSSTTGTAVVRPRGGASDGSADRTLPLVGGATIWGEFDSVISGTATNVVLFWART